ncbi:hypothetical protein E2P81_ATG07451 [Venturia nashicola]|uniref:Sld7 C-terminal domain-containing protein n=1 Tax=Venturia nashicola TaxID=86259 RepID=A0A4Z1PE48_9PEZI|nr:hypothetical protein E6O75_ATG07606 [Venturia nashicola]TLD31961.1 hypothetical protein E2P81_ATG07451 [Venturia nashicola]
MKSLILKLGDNVVDDIQLCASSRWPTLSPTIGELQFLDFVEVAKVPLSLVTGPACDVWTTNPSTADWFNDTLILHLPPEKDEASERLWWEESTKQSDIGILSQVKDTSTQILFYAIVDRLHDRGSSPRAISQDSVIRVQALPLCSSFISALPSPPASPEPNREDDFQFLPSIEQLRTEAIAAEKKRKRVEEVFDTAASQQRKARRRGGESIAAAASKLSSVTTLIGQKKAKGPKSHKEDDSVSILPQPRSDPATFAPPIQTGRPHSRSPSFSSDNRPASRRRLLDNNAKRSSLSRVTSLSENATVEDANKEMISRLVMAGMRLYGIQRKKQTHSRRNSDNISNVASMGNGVNDGVKEEAIKDEEYKLMYHQTYKAACFTHRRQIATLPLHLDPEPLRDTVDKLLAIFCADPITDG